MCVQKLVVGCGKRNEIHSRLELFDRLFIVCLQFCVVALICDTFKCMIGNMRNVWLPNAIKHFVEMQDGEREGEIEAEKNKCKIDLYNDTFFTHFSC